MTSLRLKPEPVPLKRALDGAIRVGGTRVTLDTLIEAYREGATPEEMVQQYTTLELADVYAAIGYYLRHPSQVERYLGERGALQEEVRRENERRFPSAGLRERLLNRRTKRP